MGRKVEINYSKVKEISDLGLSIKETLELLHECNINISRMQYYRWKQNNVTSINNVTSNTSNANTKLPNKCNYVTNNNVTLKHSSNTKDNVTSSKKDDYVTNNNVTSKGRYEVVGLGLENRTELIGKRFATVDEITSIGIDEIFIYDYELGRCLSREYVEKEKPFIPSEWR